MNSADILGSVFAHSGVISYVSAYPWGFTAPLALCFVHFDGNVTQHPAAESTRFLLRGGIYLFIS
jgi:hypothetical protein